MKRAYQYDVTMLRFALQKGPLTKSGSHWRFGRRRFLPRTVNALIDAGEAIRVGDNVVAWSAARA